MSRFTRFFIVDLRVHEYDRVEDKTRHLYIKERNLLKRINKMGTTDLPESETIGCNKNIVAAPVYSSTIAS